MGGGDKKAYHHRVRNQGANKNISYWLVIPSFILSL